MMDAYAARKGIATESLRFQLDGNRISGDDTPKMVGRFICNYILLDFIA